MRDPLDLLTPPTAGLEPATKRRILDATLRELHRQRRHSRVRATAALAALAAVLLLFALIPPPPCLVTRPRGVVADEPVVEPTSAIALEWQALDRPEQAKQAYRRAGERYVEEGDFVGAVRSYGGAMDAGTAEDLETSPGDDYLLMAIKLARKKEMER